jgi:molecular chaperone HscB
VSDYFALLGQPRRPWLDADALKEAFHRLAAQVHPDRVASASPTVRAEANERFAELNAAYSTLRDIKLRLAHLLQLETGSVPREIQRIPAAVADLIFEAGQLIRDADDLIAAKAANTSPMLKLRHFEAGLALADKLLALQRRLNDVAGTLDREMRDLNPHWSRADGVEPARRADLLPLGRLTDLYHAQSYVTRWMQQLQERIAQLAM